MPAPEEQSPFTLADARDGQWLRVESVDGAEITVQALRFGIAAGSRIQVQKNIPQGPVIVSKKHVEIAIGRDIAERVVVGLSTDS